MSKEPNKFQFDKDTTFEEIRELMSKFAVERDWEKYHQPRNLLLAMMGEVGELAELFQWRGDAQSETGLPKFSKMEKEMLEDELADVSLYLIRLAMQCHVDLPNAIKRKVQKNAVKYPVDLAKGNSLKYSELKKDSKELTRITRMQEKE